MSQNDMQQIPYVAFEAATARSERIIRRLIITSVVCVVILFASNLAWLYAWMQYDYTGMATETTQDYWQDGNGYNNINTGTQGDVNNGAKTGDQEVNDNEDKAEEERK